MGVGRMMRLLRAASGRKQKELAGRLNVSAKYLSMVENERRDPSLGVVRRFAAEVGVPVSLLFAAEDPVAEQTADAELVRVSADMRRTLVELAQVSVRAMRQSGKAAF